jgi:hypothetical protein
MADDEGNLLCSNLTSGGDDRGFLLSPEIAQDDCETPGRAGRPHHSRRHGVLYEVQDAVQKMMARQ